MSKHSKPTSTNKFPKKRLARKVVFSALYAAHVTQGQIDYSGIQKNMSEESEVDESYVRQLLTAHASHQEQITALINGCAQLKTRVSNTSIEQAILEMATAELISTDTPKKVVINEAIEIAKEYATDDGYKYINAVLDCIEKKITC